MNDIQDKYDDLKNIVDSLDTLIDEIDNNYYRNVLKDIRDEAIEDLEEVEEDLREEQINETKQQDCYYENK